MSITSLVKLASDIVLANCGFFTPFQLNFAITYKCSSRCKTCNIWKTKSKDELTTSEIKKIAEKSKFIHWLRLTGGEPFLRKDYVKIVEIFYKNLNLYILTTPTNALCMTTYNQIEEVLNFFDRKYIITISVDGPEKIHDEIRGVKGNWWKALSLFERLKNLEKVYKNFKVYFGYTISPYNIGCFQKTLEDLKKYYPISVDDFHFNLFQVSYYFKNLHLKLRKNFLKRAREEIDNILKLKRKKLDVISLTEKKFLILAKKYLKNKKIPLNCNILNLSCYVDPFGNVFPCISLNKKLGNLRDFGYNLQKILVSDESDKIRKYISRGLCNCWTPCEAHQMILSNWLKC
jgi:MoaA/NifB/PqqE/SkfB family radical SAM enzyme